MSTHPSLRDRRFAVVAVNGPHPGQARRSIRKRELRRIRLGEDEQEAAQLGITVSELHRRRWEQTQQIWAEEATRQKQASRAAEEDMRKWRSRWGITTRL